MNAYRDQYAQIFGGGKDAVLIAISTDTPEELASWAKDQDYPFTFASDREGKAGKPYGAWLHGRNLVNRTLYVIGPDGKVAHVAAPFREVDPTSYTTLAEAVKAANAKAKHGKGHAKDKAKASE